jgi:hypothetical protein
MPTLDMVIRSLLPGFVTAIALMVVLAGVRLAMRNESVNPRITLPLSLLTLYLALLGLMVPLGLYWTGGFSAVQLISRLVLCLALVLAIAFFVFDLFLERYRSRDTPTILRDLIITTVYTLSVFVVLSQHGVDLTSILTT